MPCLLLIAGLAFPRVIMVLLFFFTNILQRAYHGALLLPLLGFFFLPITTLVYALIVNAGYPPTGLYLVALVICAVADLGLIGGGARNRGRSSRD